MKAELERLVAERWDDETGAEAIALLVEWIRLEGRARRLVREAGTAPSPPADFAALTLHEAARRILEEEGRPLHARELGERIKERGWRHRRTASPRPDQIVFQLAARLPKHRDVFCRVAPNTFGLTSWTETDRIVRPKPRLGTLGSGGRVSGAMIGQHPDAPIDADEAGWRSS